VIGAAAVLLLLPLVRTEPAPTGRRRLPGALGNTSPEYIIGKAVGHQIQETRPCYLLPQHLDSL
jgi:hypothetical protein